MSIDTPTNAVEVSESFSVHNASAANWVVRKVNEARAYARHVEQWATAERHRAEREEAFLLHRYGHQLENWARQQIAQRHDGRKSIFLPSGAIGFRTTPTALVVQNEPFLLAWCRKNLPNAVKIHESILRSAVLEHVRTTGEVVEGAEVCGGEEKFFIRQEKVEGVDGAAAE